MDRQVASIDGCATICATFRSGGRSRLGSRLRRCGGGRKHRETFYPSRFASRQGPARSRGARAPKLTGNPFTNLRQHRVGSDVEPRSQDHRHGAFRPLRSGASRDGPASGGPDTRHAGTYPRSADEDGLESGIGRALPANSRASPLCMGSPRGGSMNDELPVRKSRDGSRWSGRRRVVIEPRPRRWRSWHRRVCRGGRGTPAGAGRRCGPA